MPPIWLAAAGLAALWATAGAAALTHRPASVAGFRVFSVRVPSDYARPQGASVNIRVAVASALEPAAEGDPIFVIEDLGESGVGAAPLGLIDSLKDLRHTHDLVFIDQRGTSGSTQLVCPRLASGSPSQDETLGLLAPQRVAACRQAFAGRADLLSLNSGTFAADLETVRRRMRARRIELIGYFYGTRIIEQYLRRWPSRVSAAVLTDFSPLNYPAAVARERAETQAVRSTLAACRAEPRCHARYPSLSEEWARIAARMPTEQLSVPPSRSGGVQIRADGAGVVSWLAARTLRWRSARDWPEDVHALANDDPGEIVRKYLAYRRTVLANFPIALLLSVDCSENMPREYSAAENADPFDSADFFKAERAACKLWPTRPLPESFFRPVRAATPVLVITAAFDVEAPAAAARRALSGFPHAKLVVIPGRARATDYDWDLCVGPLATSFLGTQGRGRVETTCVTRLKRSAFDIATAP